MILRRRYRTKLSEQRWHQFMQAQQKNLHPPAETQGRFAAESHHRRNRADRGKGRSMADAPEIDGAVYVDARRPLRIGEITTVKIERADEYDLHGTAVGF